MRDLTEDAINRLNAVEVSARVPGKTTFVEAEEHWQRGGYQSWVNAVNERDYAPPMRGVRRRRGGY